MDSTFANVMVVLGAVVIAVPLFQRLGLGSILGYLVAGTIIGPFGLAMVDDTAAISKLAHFGIVFLLFIIGLELAPKRLWDMRMGVFVGGPIQLLASAMLILPVMLWMGLELKAAGVIAFGLALSSTAFGVQLLNERNELGSAYGSEAFSILLFQDLAVVPLLLIVSAMADSTTADPASWQQIAVGLGAIAAAVLVGRYVLKPMFGLMSSTRVQEVFTAAALLAVLGFGALFNFAGLSMELGAFAAGLLLATSPYRKALETEMMPFKGLLLGLFFISVGMSIDLPLVAGSVHWLLPLVIALVAAKFTVLYALGRLRGLDHYEALYLGACLSQGGEFALVIVAAALVAAILDTATAQIVVVAVGMSMALTPLLYLVLDRWVLSRKASDDSQMRDHPHPPAGRVIIAGFGRFGQTISRVLSARNIDFVALEKDPKHVDFVNKHCHQAYYGDATRMDILRTAGIDRAQLFVLALPDPDTSIKVAKLVHDHFPDLPIVARARNFHHAWKLDQMGISHVHLETERAGLEAAGDALTTLGLPGTAAIETVELFVEYDRLLRQEAQEEGRGYEWLEAQTTSGAARIDQLKDSVGS